MTGNLKIQPYPMAESTRRLMLSVWNGDIDIMQAGNLFYYLELHFPKNKLDVALSWLVQNNLKGKRLMDFFNDDCKASNLEMHRRLLAEVERIEATSRRIMAGVDFK